MKLFIQIPCLNEEQTLPLVLKDIPKSIPGISSIELMIIDDGSTDKTIEVAKKHGVGHIVRHARNRGLARSFRDGIAYALENGADIVVNTDGDNQYPSDRIADLVQPIVQGTADIVIADRQTQTIAHFSPLKKLLQRFGTKVVNIAAKTNLPDAPSGFRAYSKQAMLEITTVTAFSYAMETIIQAGNKRLAISSIPITVNPKLRESRLFKSMWSHVRQSGIAIARAYIMYRPYVVFSTLGTVMLALGLIPFVRYVILQLIGDDGNHIQSLLIGTVLLSGALISYALGVIADLIRINRVLQEETLEHLKRLRFK